MRRRLLALAVLVLVSAGSPRADVAPFPSWRLAANGTITRAIQAGPAVYVAGNFTKIGKAVPAFAATLDPATLDFVPRSGCAQSGTGLVPDRYLFYPVPSSDGAGPFPVAPGTVLVRVGADCRFDRRFRVVVPTGVLLFPGSLSPLPIEARGHVYVYVFVANVSYLVEFDGITGAMQRYWPGASAPVAGAMPDGRLIGLTSITSNTATDVGVFDPDTGQFTVSYSTPGSWRLRHAGAVAIVSRSVGLEDELIALDAATLTPLPQWPAVRVSPEAVFASNGGRVVMAARQVSVNGAPAAHVVAFDSASGAPVGSFSPPSWLDDADSRVAHLTVSNGRVIAVGDFPPSAPRDTIAAFDATTGALDPWTRSEVFPTPEVNGGLLYFSRVDARDRVARAWIAAVASATGDVLPFTAAVPQVPSLLGGYALAADVGAGQLYVGWTGAVRRYDMATGQLDTSWTLDTQNLTSGFNQISDIALLGNTVYASGSFLEVRDNPGAAWQSREGAAAITKAGSLATWQPQVQGNCFIPVRPVGINFPCVSQLAAMTGHIVLRGRVQRRQFPSEPSRAMMSVNPDTGVDDGLIPPVAGGIVPSMATDGSVVFANAQLPSPTLIRIDDVSGARVVGPLAYNSFGGTSYMAVKGTRLYVDLERDAATTLPTGNPMQWQQPIATSSGVLDLVNDRLAFHADVAGVAPRPPVNLTASLDANTVRLQWSPGAGDLAPLVSPPAPGGTAATSHIVLASVAPGGPPAAQIDTASADTSFPIAAPTGTFYVRVQAKNAFGTSAPSVEVRVDVQPQAPNPPLATIASVSGGVVHIEWQAPPLGWAATSYRLEAGTAPGLANIGTLPVNGLSFDAPVPPGRYYVRVRGVNAYGASGPGDEVVIDVP